MRLAEIRPTAPSGPPETHLDGLFHTPDALPLTVFVTKLVLGVRVIHVVGEIDLGTKDRVHARLLDELTTALPYAAVIDFSGVSFLGVCGLALLDQIDHTARRSGTQVRLVATTRAVTRLVELDALDQRIPTHTSIQDALNHCLNTAPEARS